MRISGVLLGFLAAPLWAGGLTQGDRDFALSQLHATRKMFVDTVSGLSAAQWKYKTADDRWSIAEVAQHIVLSEDFMMEYLKKELAKPASAPKFRRADDERLYAKWMDRSRKVDAPAELKPQGKLPSPSEAAREFSAKRDRTLDYVRTTQDDLRSHIAGSGENESDTYQWVLGFAAHTERHMAQIREVMASPGFPKK